MRTFKEHLKYFEFDNGSKLNDINDFNGYEFGQFYQQLTNKKLQVSAAQFAYKNEEENKPNAFVDAGIDSDKNYHQVHNCAVSVHKEYLYGADITRRAVEIVSKSNEEVNKRTIISTISTLLEPEAYLSSYNTKGAILAKQKFVIGKIDEKYQETGHVGLGIHSLDNTKTFMWWSNGVFNLNGEHIHKRLPTSFNKNDDITVELHFGLYASKDKSKHFARLQFKRGGTRILSRKIPNGTYKFIISTSSIVRKNVQENIISFGSLHTQQQIPKIENCERRNDISFRFVDKKEERQQQQKKVPLKKKSDIKAHHTLRPSAQEFIPGVSAQPESQRKNIFASAYQGIKMPSTPRTKKSNKIARTPITKIAEVQTVAAVSVSVSGGYRSSQIKQKPFFKNNQMEKPIPVAVAIKDDDEKRNIVRPQEQKRVETKRRKQTVYPKKTVFLKDFPQFFEMFSIYFGDVDGINSNNKLLFQFRKDIRRKGTYTHIIIQRLFQDWYTISDFEIIACKNDQYQLWGVKKGKKCNNKMVYVLNKKFYDYTGKKKAIDWEYFTMGYKEDIERIIPNCENFKFETIKSKAFAIE